MRALKFRVWDIDNKEFVYVSETTDGEIWINNGISTVTMPEHKTPYEQYTGLKDKNGKEIYDGDIVEYDWYIIGDKPAYRVNSVVNFDYKGAMGGNNRLWKCTNIEVIGNIHENPELLRGEE